MERPRQPDLGGSDPVGLKLHAILDLAALPAILLLVLLLPVPVLSGVADVSSLFLGLTLTLIGLALAFAQPAPDRGIALSLFVLGFVIRLGVLLLVSTTPGYDRVGFLGPDSATFYRESQMLARSEFALGTSPETFFGTTDIAHYYLFAGAISVFHADLFGLQLLNGGLMALVAPVTFLWMRTQIPRHALISGVLVACSPSLVAISSIDLLKDPSIVLATSVAVWGIARLLTAERLLTSVAWGMVSALALTYVRMDRFYVAAYLEAALLLTVAVAVLRSVGPPRPQILVLVLALAAAELAPLATGQPLSAVQVVNNIVHVEQSPLVRDYTPGLIDQTTLVQATSGVANVIRRLYGPFVWIPPSNWDIQAILQSDLLLYPGMLIWYALLPLMVTGVAAVVWWFLSRRATSVLLPAIALFLIVYMAQYLAINLSYRQREDVFPLALAFVPFGIALWTRVNHHRLLYGLYWLGIALIAALHHTLRALTAT